MRLNDMKVYTFTYDVEYLSECSKKYTPEQYAIAFQSYQNLVDVYPVYGMLQRCPDVNIQDSSFLIEKVYEMDEIWNIDVVPLDTPSGFKFKQFINNGNTLYGFLIFSSVEMESDYNKYYELIINELIAVYNINMFVQDHGLKNVK